MLLHFFIVFPSFPFIPFHFGEITIEANEKVLYIADAKELNPPFIFSPFPLDSVNNSFFPSKMFLNKDSSSSKQIILLFFNTINTWMDKMFELLFAYFYDNMLVLQKPTYDE